MAKRYAPPARLAAESPRLAILREAAVQLRSRAALLPPSLSERTIADIDPARTFNTASFAWQSAPTGGGGGNGGGGAGGGTGGTGGDGWER